MGKKQTENCFRKRSRQTVNKEVKRGCYFILRQIVLQRGIPFEMKLPAYEEPVAYGSLTKEQFNAEIEKGMEDIIVEGRKIGINLLSYENYNVDVEG